MIRTYYILDIVESVVHSELAKDDYLCVIFWGINLLLGVSVISVIGALILNSVVLRFKNALSSYQRCDSILLIIFKY